MTGKPEVNFSIADYPGVDVYVARFVALEARRTVTGAHRSTCPAVWNAATICSTAFDGQVKILRRFTRWMYRGQRPHLLARIMNRVSAVVASLGVTPNYMETLEVTGRKSGRTHSLPVVITVVGRERYLVSMLGENVQWVENVRASGGRAVLRSTKREEIHLEEVPTAERAPILKAYLQRAPGARPHVPVDKDAPLAEFEKIASAFPVFRIGGGDQRHG
jgi:deazaflavin-dependent oxidoreductase (nitroreductase family)